MQSHILDKGINTIVTLDVARDSENVRLMRLHNGRRLAYTEYGDSHGYPLLHCHSRGSSRLEAASLHKAALALGFRIIAVDRPGVGLSDYYEHTSAQGFAMDLLCLADKLRCKRFGLLANGGGASYALALASSAPDRVSVVLGMSCQFPSMSQAGVLLSKCASLAIKLSIFCRHLIAKHSPSRYLQRIFETLSYADRRLLENPKLLAYVENDIKEALRQGVRGIAQDSALQFNDAGIDATKLSMPCHFWRGSADCRRTMHLADRFVAQCPQGQVHELLNRGHYFYLRNAEEVFVTANLLLERGAKKVPGNTVLWAQSEENARFVPAKLVNH